MLQTRHEIEVRVRYQETDGQGRVYHGNYVTWFEMARIELLRASGYSYKQLEREGVFLVIADLNVQYFAAVEFDDLVKIKVVTERSKGVRIINVYEVHRGDTLIATGRTVAACVDPAGKVRPLPEWLRLP